MTRWSHIVAVAVAALALSLSAGCSSLLGSNQPRDPSTEVPDDFGQPAVQAGPSVAVQRQWDAFFDDPNLRSLIAEALENNQALNIQVQEIIVAQNAMAGIRGEYLPSLDAAAGAGVERVGGFTSQGVSDAANGVPNPLPSFGFGLVASWETDIASHFRNARKAAGYRYEATIQELNFLKTEIVAEIARSYYDLCALDLQIEILQRNIEFQKSALEIVKLKKAAARGTELGVQRFQAEVLKNQGRVFDLDQQRIIVENRINFLVGRFPQPVQRSTATFMSAQPEVVTVGLPADLLDNRPDVKAAELRLEAAKFDTKSAKARFYPSLRIDAGVGFQSFSAAHLLSPESLVMNVAGGLVAPLLNRTAIKAEYRSANAEQIQAVFEYERAILQAYTDVYNQLLAISNYRQRFEQLTQQVTTLREAIEVSKALYQSAQADYFEVLMTIRDSLEAEIELVEARKVQLQAIVAVYQALGGGWRVSAAAGGDAGTS
ncbi:MAG: TolC family protein [Myxococcales bacterium]|nr:TolC family protein [Myxococcales bacterium]